jgi:ornithine carbamoyltransferase
MDVTVVCPDNPKYSPNTDIINRTKEKTGKEVRVDHDPERGVEDADVIYTDVWISAGMERERIDRMKIFPPYQVNTDLISKADPEVIVMHCMPAHRGYEITGEVMDSDRSVIIDQAENRMHAQKGLLYWLLKT